LYVAVAKHSIIIMGSVGTPKSIRRANPVQIRDSVFKMFDMHGKVTIITGGSGGIGYEVGRALAEAGSDIALWYHKSSNALKLAASIEKDFGVRCKAYQCAVENFDEV
jgi:sorbose reductase